MTLSRTLNSKKMWMALFGYHLLFTIVGFQYFKEKGGDASFYWHQLPLQSSRNWSDYFHYGSDFIAFLNYPFAKIIHLDIVFGFFLYSCIGFLGIVQFYKFIAFHIGDQLNWRGFNLALLLLWLPNLHFWTAILGKESICFLCLSTIFLELSKRNFKSIWLTLSMLFLCIIRPHIALMLLFGIGCCYLIFEKVQLKIKLLILFLGSLLLSVLFYMFLQLSEIKSFDWEKIKRYNEFSVLSFRNSNTYVPMLEYSYPYKLFTFYFRPLLDESPSFFGLVLGVENLLVLVVHVAALIIAIFQFKKITMPVVFKGILFFTLISGILIVQRYSGFGIFARTKIMMQPFVLVVLVWILSRVKTSFSLK